MKNKLKGLLATFALAGTIFVGMPAEETYAVNQCYITITTNNTGSNAAIGTGPCYQKGYYNGSGFVVVGDYTGPVTNGEVVDLFASGGDGGNNSGPAQLHITTVSAPAPQPAPAPTPKPAPAPAPQPTPEPKPVAPAPAPQPTPKQEQVQTSPTVPKAEATVTNPSTPSSSPKVNTGEKGKNTDGATDQVESSTNEESKQEQENEVANPYTVEQLKDRNSKVVEKDGKLFATFEEDGKETEQEISEAEAKELGYKAPKEEEKKENKSKQKKEEKELPNTATNVGNIIIIGSLLLVIGGTIFVIVRKRHTNMN